MHYFTFAEKDTTLYQASASLNAGMDEILEIKKEVSDSGDSVNVSRILVKFDLSYISASMVNSTITNPSFYLNLYDARSQNLITSQSLYAYPVSGSWIMGDGNAYDNPITTEGCSWQYVDGEIGGTIWPGDVSSSGGNWKQEISASYAITHKTSDIRINVTDIVKSWLSGSVSNEGFMVKRNGNRGNTDTNTDEGNTTRFGDLAFFSSDTHTKYHPTLETVWNDSTWSEGSLSPLTQANIEDMTIYMKGLRPEYKEKSKVKFRLVGKERFPEKTYSTTPSNLNVKTLPSGSSYYSIKDAETADVIVPFGTGSFISCDSTGNFFNLWLDGYQAERYYTLEFRVKSGSGSDEIDQYFDEGFTFKVSQ